MQIENTHTRIFNLKQGDKFTFANKQITYEVTAVTEKALSYQHTENKRKFSISKEYRSNNYRVFKIK